jgi:flavin-dependent dehydrogenase
MSTNGSAPGGGGLDRHRVAGEHYDVIIVGARCAGSSLATLLAREGLRVVVVEQARFPRTTLSSHLIEADGLLFLKRIGVLDTVRGTGVRFMKRIDIKLNDLHVEGRFPLRFDDVGGAAFLRRHLLDSILADAAAASGAEMRMGHKVVEVLWDRQRVCGVRVEHDGVETPLYAPLVVGADGRTSTIGYMCGSRKYNVHPNERSYYFTFFEGADAASDDHFVFHRWGDRMVWAGPADSGLYLVGVSPESHERDYFRNNTEAGLLAHMRMCPPTAGALANARIATKIFGIRNFDGYFRQPSGRGWVLVGDSGHFKDPAAGRGIGDAFMQVEELAPAIVGGLGASVGHLDLALRRWGEWRDRRFAGHYWLATVLGKAGTFPRMVPEAVQRLRDRGELDRFVDLFSHRSQFDDVFPLSAMGAATMRLMLSGRVARGPLLRDAIKLLAQEPVRRWTDRYPYMAASDVSAAPPVRPAPPRDRPGMPQQTGNGTDAAQAVGVVKTDAP